MALVGESAHKRYFGKRRICRQHQILGRLDAPPYRPAMWETPVLRANALAKWLTKSPHSLAIRSNESSPLRIARAEIAN
jgi:hypothetical protein